MQIDKEKELVLIKRFQLNKGKINSFVTIGNHYSKKTNVDKSTIIDMNYDVYDSELLNNCESAFNVIESENYEFANAIGDKPGFWGVRKRETHEIILEPQFLYCPEYAYFKSYVGYKGQKWHFEGNTLKSNEQKCGIIKEDGSVIIPFNYEAIKPVWKIGSDESQRKYIVRQNGKWGVIDLKEKLCIPFRYEDINEDLSTAQYTFLCKPFDNENEFEEITI